ncbi:MAG: MFS transporter, partial [Catalinimonas sp.]
MNYPQLVGRYPRYLGYGFLHYFFSSLGQTFLISNFVPYFNEDFGLTSAEFSLFYLTATLASGFTLPWLGGLVDRRPVRQISVVNGLAMAGFCVLLSLTRQPYLLLLSLYGLRLTGQGMMILIGSTAVARYFTTARGKALSLASLGLSLGEMVLPLALTALIAAWGWPA